MSTNGNNEAQDLASAHILPELVTRLSPITGAVQAEDIAPQKPHPSPDGRVVGKLLKCGNRRFAAYTAK